MLEERDGEADLVVDVHGMMHDRDQKAGILERLRHMGPDTVLLMMIHDVTGILRSGMWNALKSGHFAYYSAPSLVAMAEEIGLEAVGAWEYALYNHGTTMLAFAQRLPRWWTGRRPKASPTRSASPGWANRWRRRRPPSAGSWTAHAGRVSRSPATAPRRARRPCSCQPASPRTT